MEVASANINGLDGAFPLNGDASRASLQTTQEELEEDERQTSLNITSGDAVNISPAGRTLASGGVESYEEALDLLGMTTGSMLNHREFAIGAHTGLEAYRVAALLEGLE